MKINEETANSLKILIFQTQQRKPLKIDMWCISLLIKQKWTVNFVSELGYIKEEKINCIIPCKWVADLYRIFYIDKTAYVHLINNYERNELKIIPPWEQKINICQIWKITALEIIEYVETCGFLHIFIGQQPIILVNLSDGIYQIDNYISGENVYPRCIRIILFNDIDFINLIENVSLDGWNRFFECNESSLKNVWNGEIQIMISGHDHN
jgi:hypothetical protein